MMWINEYSSKCTRKFTVFSYKGFLIYTKTSYELMNKISHSL